MLDELLGRAALKERVAELEAERDSLRERLDAEERRRADAATARQEAERQVNRLEDRVAELEDRVERAEGDADGLSLRGTERLRGDRRDAVLARLRSVEAGPDGAFTAMVTDGAGLPAAVADAFGDRAPLVRRTAPCLAVTDDAGLVGAALVPPVAPESFETWDDRFRVERSWFAPEGRYALAVVRADLFALGEYDGTERLSVTGFESDVQGAHSKGGFSQRRFERRRDEQVAAHVDRVREALAGRTADRLYLTGESVLLGELADEVDADATRPSDATGDPEAALADAYADFWTVRLALL
ncbi:MAG: Vms1/Ankzf1 family peptidyl-tRNA hydrolase [Halobacteriaceae archaeon]